MLKYKINVLEALKEKGINTTRLRREKLLSEGAIQRLRTDQPISWSNIEQICKLLDCQPSDFLTYEK
jgi:putative transcriptional regulator